MVRVQSRDLCVRRERVCARIAAASVGLLLAIACAGCLDLPEFSSESLVDRPRILALVAEPPEVTPGSEISLGVLVAGAREVQRVEWRACSPLDAFSSNSQYGENAGDQTCGDGPALEVGERVQVPADKTQLFFGDDDELRRHLGTSLSGATLDVIRKTVGITFTVEATVLADGKRLRAQKRVLLRDTATPHHNPPVPELSFDGRAVHGDDADSMSFVCRAEHGSAEQTLPGAHVKLAPILDGDDEPWLERYTVLDASGAARSREERASYAWFVSAGTLDDGTTRAPDRENEWIAPSTPGCVTLWLVVRDGHGGESACGLAVNVGTVDTPDTCGSIDTDP